LSVPADAAGVPGSAGFDGVSFWNFFGSSDPGTLTDCGGPTLSIPASRPDDVGFIDRLLDTMLDEYCVDSGRVFATGMSNGAGMSTTLGCELGDRFAAIAPVAGDNLSGACPGDDDPVSVLAIHGDADAIAGYGGNNLLGFQLGNPSVPDRMAAWAAYDGCEVGPTIDPVDCGPGRHELVRVRRRHRRRAVDPRRLESWVASRDRSRPAGRHRRHRRGARVLRRPGPVLT
jgi:polyhydroxybutyrate depolymerase